MPWRHCQCLHFDLKELVMPSFWPEGIGNAFPLSKNHCKCLSFWPEGIANAFLFTSNGKFSLTIGMIMPLGWGEVTGTIPKLVTQDPFGFPTRHSWLRHLWLVGNPNGLSWLVWELFFPFTRGKPLVKGKSPCLCLSLKASRHFSKKYTLQKPGSFRVKLGYFLNFLKML